jgi:hypothetical protein
MRDILFDQLWTEPQVDVTYWQDNNIDDSEPTDSATTHDMTEVFRMFDMHSDEGIETFNNPLMMEAEQFFVGVNMDHQPSSLTQSPDPSHSVDISIGPLKDPHTTVDTEDEEDKIKPTKSNIKLSPKKAEPTQKPSNPTLFYFMPQQQDDDLSPRHSPTTNTTVDNVNNPTSPQKNVRTTIVRTAKAQGRPATAKIAKRKKKTSTETGKKFTAVIESTTTQLITNECQSETQISCCISGCHNAVTNRLRFSLRRPCTFKDDFLLRSFNKICSCKSHSVYFLTY